MANGTPSVPACPRFRWMRRVSSFAPAADPTTSEAECRIHRPAICWKTFHPAGELRANRTDVLEPVAAVYDRRRSQSAATVLNPDAGLVADLRVPRGARGTWRPEA